MQITPVATGKGTQSTISIDGTKKHGDGISSRANGTAPICRCSSAVANHVSTVTTSQATSQTSSGGGGGAASVSSGATPSTSKPSTSGQSSGQFGAKSRSGSLDQLLFLTDRLAAHTLSRQENRHTGQREITADDLFNYLKDLNGDLKFLDKKKLAQLLLQNTEAFVAQQHYHQHPSHPTGTIRKHQPASRQESTGESTSTKQIQFANHVGPTTPAPSVPIDAPTKGILQTSRKGSKFDSNQQKEFSDEWLERSQFPRTSSRSMETSTLPKADDKDESKQRHHKHHQRHFSGPEELEALKKDIAHWLERLPYKRDTALLELIDTAVKLKQQQKQQALSTAPTPSVTSGTKPKSIIKSEFSEIIRPPLPQKQRQQAQGPSQSQQEPPPLPVKQFQRQKSADDLRVLKNNILEWLTKQQIMNQHRSLVQQKKQQKQQQQSVPSNSAMIDMLTNEIKSDRTGTAAAVPTPSTAPPPLPRKVHQKVSKRHSLGPSETSSDFHEFPDWMQIPVDKMSKIREIQKSCTDIPKKSGIARDKSIERPKHHHSTSNERKLRHSASEVVQSNQSYMKSMQPQHLQQHFQYQIIQKPQSYQYQPTQQQPQSNFVHSQQGAITAQPTPQQIAAQPQYQVVQRRSKTTLGHDKSHHSHHGHHSSNNTERSSKRDKPRHRQTQRSATTGNILLNRDQHHQQPQPLPVMNHVDGRNSSNFYQSTSSLVRCDDPMCPLLPICTDPNCYLNANSYYDTPRRASLPLQDVVPLQDSSGICTDPRCCEMLPMCTDPRCCATVPTTAVATTSQQLPAAPACSKTKPAPQHELIIGGRCSSSSATNRQKFKSNSLPRCVESTRRNDPFLSDLAKNESYSSLPKSATLSSATANHHRPTRHHQHHQRISKKQLANQMLFDEQHDSQSLMQQMMPILKQLSSSSSSQHRNGGSSGNNKLLKSASTTSLHSRRRRHKTVTFGENLLREVCMNRELINPLTDQQPSNNTSARLQPNIQMLYNFVEGVLSAWVDEEDDDHIKSGPDSEPERGAALKPFHRCNRARLQTIRRIVNEAASLKGTLKLGNSRYRHRHWRGTAKDCNERFLRKVNFVQLPPNKKKSTTEISLSFSHHSSKSISLSFNLTVTRNT